MSSIAIKRLMTEHKELQRNPVEGIQAGPLTSDNFLIWEAKIAGPPGTPFEGGIFPAILTFPRDYPLNPPSMRFTCEMFHPNIYQDGRVCISILHAPGEDPMNYESSAERWSPVQSIEKILLSVISMLASPNPDSGANVDASSCFRKRPEEYEMTVRRMVERVMAKQQLGS